MSGYDADILEWSERQAALLRRIVAGERVKEIPDWEKIIEEIESVGAEQLHAVESLLLQTMLHLLKAQCWPDSRAAGKWRADARVFRSQARRRFAPSMRQKIDLAGLYADALAGLPDEMDDRAPLPPPSECPFSLDQLLAGE